MSKQTSGRSRYRKSLTYLVTFYGQVQCKTRIVMASEPGSWCNGNNKHYSEAYEEIYEYLSKQHPGGIIKIQSILEIDNARE